MDVRYTTGQDDRDVSNPVYDEKKQLEGQVQLDDSYSMPDEALKNPLFFDDMKGIQRNPHLMKVTVGVFLLQAVTLVMMVAMIIIGLFIAVNMSPMANSGSLGSCDNNSRGYNASHYVSLMGGLTELLQITKNVSKSLGFFDDLSQAYQNSSRSLYNIVGSLSTIKATATTTDGTVNDVLLAIQDILDSLNASSLINSIQTVSCQDILSAYPSSPTGYYHVNARDIYCNMDQLCGNGGGWTRLGYFDMTDGTQNCPDGFRLYTSGNVRACGRLASGGNCASSVKLQTNGISYTQICGRVIGYQYGSPDAVITNVNNLNSPYIDGVSITRGNPRQHVWSLIGGVFGSRFHNNNCPCNNPPSPKSPQSFVGNNYFCESGNPNNGWARRLYANDPLWDGQGCNSQEGPCCNATGLPWFYRDYGNMSTTDYIELRVCGNQGTGDEDNPISFYEIYVK